MPWRVTELAATSSLPPPWAANWCAEGTTYDWPSPELVAFVESTGLVAVPYGPKVQEFLDEEFLRNMWADFFRNPIRQLPKVWDPIIKYWPDVSTTLKSLAAGADLLATGLNFEQAAANVAEYYDIPLASLHHFPMRANGRLVPSMPALWSARR